jgi:tRNA A58 N-methylase Trm61
MKLFAAILITCGAIWGQSQGDVNAQYRTHEGREQVAARLADPNRAKTQKPEAVVAALGLRPGMTVADVGTGIGFMLPYLSRAVGPQGKVLAEDIQTDFLDKAKATIAANKLTNVTTVLGTSTDPKLPAGGVDVALVLDVYHHFDQPAKMLAALRSELKPDGRLAIVEFHKAKSPQPGHIQRTEADLIAEVEAQGFRVVSKNDQITDTQYLVVFGKK